MKRSKPTMLGIGSVSSGTMRLEDLIPSFVWECDHLRLTRGERSKLTAIKRNADQNEDAEYWSSEEASCDLDALFDILNNHCPPYMCFGAHPGDGACYGCWLTEDLDECFDGLKVSDLSEVEKGHTGEVLLVNDHGNTSLYSYYRGRAREVWAVV